MKKYLLSLVAMLMAIGVQANDQVWWGYYTDGGQRVAVGYDVAETIDQAIYIPWNHDVLKGNTIKGIRFYLRTIDNVKDVKVWISTTLPTTGAKANERVQNVPITALQGGDENATHVGLLNEVTLTKPYTMAKKGVYVGVSYTMTRNTIQQERYPIVLGTESGINNSCYIRKASSTSWENANSYGPVALGVLVDGNFNDNAAAIDAVNDVTLGIGKSVEIEATLTNYGLKPISSIDYTLANEGETAEEKHVELSTPVDVFGARIKLPVTVQASDEKGFQKKTLTITKVNGEANKANVPSAAFTVVTVSKTPHHGVLVEEYTGTGCGWCPRGLAGMKKMRLAYGDQFVGVALHGYNSSDPLYPSGYNNSVLRTFTGAPSCFMNRGGSIDPYYGSGDDILDDIDAALALPVKADIDLVGVWNEDSTEVVATATVENLTATASTFTIEYALIADSVVGSGSSWNQSNYYSSYAPSGDPWIDQFCQGGQYGQSSISGWAFDDAFIAGCFSGSTNQAPALGKLTFGEPVTNTFTLKMPTKENVLSAIDKDKVAVVVIIVASDKSVVNARKYYLKHGGIPEAITTTTAQGSLHEVARYTIDGRRIDAPQKGMNIVKYSDGTTRKVLVN